jgi:hypothetical protein
MSRFRSVTILLIRYVVVAFSILVQGWAADPPPGSTERSSLAE